MVAKSRRFWLALAVIPVGLGLYLLTLQFDGNFHEVVKGELYRSAQLEPEDLGEYVNEYHIRTVLNLRGENKHVKWYESEVSESNRLGINHIDFKMSSSKELSYDEALRLINVMQAAPKPLLIHCRAGADRTGLAAAFYVAAISKGGEWAAERQMWLPYGHLPLRVNAAYAMNRTFEMMEPHFGYEPLPAGYPKVY